MLLALAALAIGSACTGNEGSPSGVSTTGDADDEDDASQASSSSGEPGPTSSPDASGSSGADGTTAGDGDTGEPPGGACAHDDELASTLHGWRGAIEDCEEVGALWQEHFTVAPPLRVVHVAPPDGSPDGTGTRGDPRRDLKSALEAAEPGDHFHLAPGVYPMNEIRDAYGHDGSLVFLSSEGTRDAKIVVQTDPDLYDPSRGAVAQIDFQFGNSWPNHRTFGMSLSGSHWVLQRLELRNFESNGLWVSGTHNVIRDNEIHHVHHDGTNNHGLVVAATSGPSYNLVMGNHLHHSGGLDEAGDLVDIGGLNGGCTYSETRQGYDSDLGGIDASSSWEELQAAMNAPDSEFYYYGNVVHHCHNGIATKNNSEGPFYVLSNVISESEIGIKISLAHSVVRNNIVFGEEPFDTGILVGWSASSGWISQVLNGVDITVANNTIVGAVNGTSHYSGWNLRLQSNAFVDIQTAHLLHRNVYGWYPNDWPGVVGEWVWGDLGPEHPYYEFMPQALKDQVGVFRRVEASGNVYPFEPAIAVGVESDFYELAGTLFSRDHAIVDSATVKAHMIDPDASDHRRDPDDPGPLDGVGSGIR